MKKIFLLLSLLLLVSMSSCEWIGTTFLGRPSKAELAKIAALEQHRKDSIAEVERAATAAVEMERQREADSLRKTQEVKSLQGERFHIVLGCFKVPSNATRMIERLQKEGFAPQKFELNGFECISAASFKTKDAAYHEIYRIMMEDYCPEDFWLYDVKTNLHNLGN